MIDTYHPKPPRTPAGTPAPAEGYAMEATQI